MDSQIVRVLMRFPKETIQGIEDYRHSNRIASRHQAILDLIKIGLETKNKTK